MWRNPHRTQVLRLYKRAFQLSEPYVDSAGVQEFMKRELMHELKARGNATRDELVQAEEALTRDVLLDACRENIRTLFREQRDERVVGQIEYLVRQGNIELDAMEDKVIKQQKKFGVVKDGSNVKYVVKN